MNLALVLTVPALVMVLLALALRTWFGAQKRIARRREFGGRIRRDGEDVW